jgi:hypothetical protein
LKKHLHYTRLGQGDFGDRTAEISKIKELVYRERELDKEIEEAFPIDKFISGQEKLRVIGSKDLLEQFFSIDEVKVDIVEELGNIDYIGISDNEEIILNFRLDNEPSYEGVYNFTYEFFDELFDMGKYSKFCIKHNYNDILKDNVNSLLEKMKKTKKQYRLIKKNENTYIRGITSTRYKNYDNNLAIYLTLLSLHKFAKESNTFFALKESNISDSELKLFFEQNEPVIIPNVGKVFFGVYISNSEIRTSNFNFELRYRLNDSVNEEISFAAIPPLNESVFKLQHATGTSRIITKLDNVFLINELKDKMLKFIERIKIIPSLSNEEIYGIMDIVRRSPAFCKSTGDKIKDLYDRSIINNSLSLLKCFNKINDITDDLEERIQLERIYYEIINKHKT